MLSVLLGLLLVLHLANPAQGLFLVGNLACPLPFETKRFLGIPTQLTNSFTLTDLCPLDKNAAFNITLIYLGVGWAVHATREGMWRSEDKLQEPTSSAM